jgi:hypothetical protein
MGRALGRMGMIRRASRFQVSQLSAPHSLHTKHTIPQSTSRIRNKENKGTN